ncbi:hypothetical protein HHI36_008359, partial [Cryptolaemus montrouzieri]
NMIETVLALEAENKMKRCEVEKSAVLENYQNDPLGGKNIGLVEANMNESMCINLSSESNEWIDRDVIRPTLTENNQGKLDNIQQLTIRSHIVKDGEIQVSPAECYFLEYLQVRELQKRNQELEDDLIRKEVLRRSTERDLLEMD